MGQELNAPQVRQYFHLLTYFILLAFVGGCAATAPPEKLQQYHWTSASAGLADLCQRSRAVRTVSAQCAVTLARPGGQSVRLDGALAMDLPGSVRLRAWKFGQPVFDLTLTPGGLWIESPREGPEASAMPASLSAAQVARAMTILSGEFFCSGESRALDTGAARFRLEREVQGQRIVCQVDRATLTPRQYAVLDGRGAERFSLSLGRYILVNGLPWATRLHATSPGGQVLIEMSEVDLNGELAPNAFLPPKKARKVEQ